MMIYEKIFKLAVSREAKVIVKGNRFKNSKEVTIELEYLIRDKFDSHFHPPIFASHPQCWKLKKYSPERAQLLQLQYSGVSRRQVLEVISEFKEQFGPDFIFTDKTATEQRIKHLKGIRVSALSKRMLAVT